MAAFVPFDDFPKHLGEGVHDFRAAGHTLNVYLTNATPDTANDIIKTDLTEISTGNGYIGPKDVQNDISTSGGTAIVTAVDVDWTAAGGSFGDFRYVVLYNDTPATPGDLYSDPLIGYWDYGATCTCQDGEKFTVDFDATGILKLQATV